MWRPNPYRGPEELRALFAVHCNRPQLIAAWHRGDSLDATKAQQLWAAHRWQLISPPADVAALLSADQPLVAISKYYAQRLLKLLPFSSAVACSFTTVAKLMVLVSRLGLRCIRLSLGCFAASFCGSLAYFGAGWGC